MNVLTELIDFWSNFLYGVPYSEGYTMMDGTASIWSDSVYNDLPRSSEPFDALGKGFQNFMFNFFQFLPQMLAFLTLGLAVFLFCFMMYKIIKLFTSTI